jgi:hypothetical protein
MFLLIFRGKRYSLIPGISDKASTEDGQSGKCRDIGAQVIMGI